MEINVKKLEVTTIEASVSADTSTTPPVEGETSANQSQAIVLVEMVGDVDSTTAHLVQEQILPLATPGSKMVLDMTKVPYMSSAGLRLLLSLYRHLTGQDGQLVLIGLAEEIRDTMSITGFLDFFKISDTLESGLEAINLKLLALPT